MTPKEKIIQIISKAVSESFDFNNIENNPLTSGLNKVGDDLDNIVLNDIIPFLEFRSINIRILRSEVYKLDTFYVDDQLWYSIRFKDATGISYAMMKFNQSEWIADKRSARHYSYGQQVSEEGKALAVPILKAYEDQCLKPHPSIKHNDKLRNLSYQGKISKHKNVIAISETNLYDAAIAESYQPLGFILVKAADVEEFKAKNNITESFDFSKIDNRNTSIEQVGNDLDQMVLNDSLSFLSSYNIDIEPEYILYMKPFTINGDTWYAIQLDNPNLFSYIVSKIDIFKTLPIADKESIKDLPREMRACREENWVISHPIIRTFETYILDNTTPNILYSNCGYSRGYLKYSGHMTKDHNIIILNNTNAGMKVNSVYHDVNVILFNSAAF